MTKSTPEINAKNITGNPADKIEHWKAFSGKHAHLESDGRSFTEVIGERSPNSLIGSETGKTDKADKAKAAKKKPD